MSGEKRTLHEDGATRLVIDRMVPRIDRDPTDQLLAERGRTHGCFTAQAGVSQQLKGVLRSDPGWANLTPTQRESVEMICVKLSRVVCGNAGCTDHWADVSGYARLAEQRV